MMSVDYYPISNGQEEDSDSKKVDYSIKDDYYSALETIAKFSRIHNVPFWLYMLCNKHTTYNDVPENDQEHIGYAYPYPTVEILRFQAMTALAFGIQGLVFWSYGIGMTKYYEKSKRKREVYYDAPFVNGHTTEIWDNCKVVIPEIKGYGKIMLGAKFQSAVQLYGNNETSTFRETIEFKDLPEKQFGCIKTATAKDKGFVITHLKKGDKNFLAIVSHDFTNPQKIYLGIDKTVQCAEYVRSPLGIWGSLLNINRPTDTNTKINFIVRTIPAGGILLLSY